MINKMAMHARTIHVLMAGLDGQDLTNRRDELFRQQVTHLVLLIHALLSITKSSGWSAAGSLE
jgi:hypothetical protein